MTLILDGKSVASRILADLKAEIASLEIVPKLAIVMAGNDPASEIYVKNKLIKAQDVGINAQLFRLSSSATAADILRTVDLCNKDVSVNGVIVQAPLPVESMQNVVFDSVSPEKDVDGFNSVNVSRLVRGDFSGIVPCTPLGISFLLKAYGIDLTGKHVVIVGRGGIVGRPLSILLSQKRENCNATVTLCHSMTKNLAELTRMADVVIVAVGMKHLLKKGMVKPGVTVIDVGINRDDSGDAVICGDADFMALRDICYAISPVPGGVGPMTVAMLMSNTLLAAKRQLGLV